MAAWCDGRAGAPFVKSARCVLRAQLRSDPSSGATVPDCFGRGGGGATGRFHYVTCIHACSLRSRAAGERTPCGTLSYVPPTVFLTQRAGVHREASMWAIMRIGPTCTPAPPHSAQHTQRHVPTPARPTLKVAQCGGLPLIRAGWAMRHQHCVRRTVTGFAQCSAHTGFAAPTHTSERD
jgi:hypothetical protein